MRLKSTHADPIPATRVPDGKGYKFIAENVALLLQAETRDVSPGT
ncbi:hypothetical protein [Roseovarius gahaiensis]|nr:hypothetical protein [Roseovarius gahaiensis]